MGAKESGSLRGKGQTRSNKQEATKGCTCQEKEIAIE
jgi:hypothetical protein